MRYYVWTRKTHGRPIALNSLKSLRCSPRDIWISLIKEKQREENVNLLLTEQIENTKQHISEVEKLYGNIRALKHDMGNHITVLESLFAKKEAEEFEKYLTELKAIYCVSVEGIKTGNPVTDVILTQKQKEAEESGIDFECNFVYPVDSNINAFDVSVILNNAIENALEDARFGEPFPSEDIVKVYEDGKIICWNACTKFECDDKELVQANQYPESKVEERFNERMRLS